MSTRLSLLPITIVGLAGSAHADDIVQSRVYGFLNAEVERAQAGGGATPYDPRFRVVDGGSRIGFLGSVALTPRTTRCGNSRAR